jgi:hypothetical protein
LEQESPLIDFTYNNKPKKAEFKPNASELGLGISKAVEFALARNWPPFPGIKKVTSWDFYAVSPDRSYICIECGENGPQFTIDISCTSESKEDRE